MTWEDMNITNVEIKSLAGKPCRINTRNGYEVTQDGKEITVRKSEDGSLEFDTNEGQCVFFSVL